MRDALREQGNVGKGAVRLPKILVLTHLVEADQLLYEHRVHTLLVLDRVLDARLRRSTQQTDKTTRYEMRAAFRFRLRGGILLSSFLFIQPLFPLPAGPTG